MQTFKSFNPAAFQSYSFWGAVHIPARGLELEQAIEQGFPYSTLQNLAKETGFSPSEIANFTGISKSTLNRRAQSQHFEEQESDRLYRFAEVFNSAFELFQDKNEASLWMNSDIKGLGNRKPIQLLKTSASTEQVLDLLGRLEHGIIA